MEHVRRPGYSIVCGSWEIWEVSGYRYLGASSWSSSSRALECVNLGCAAMWTKMYALEQVGLEEWECRAAPDLWRET